jgi:hypothetical protein
MTALRGLKIRSACTEAVHQTNGDALIWWRKRHGPPYLKVRRLASPLVALHRSSLARKIAANACNVVLIEEETRR